MYSIQFSGIADLLTFLSLGILTNHYSIMLFLFPRLSIHSSWLWWLMGQVDVFHYGNAIHSLSAPSKHMTLTPGSKDGHFSVCLFQPVSISTVYLSYLAGMQRGFLTHCF